MSTCIFIQGNILVDVLFILLISWLIHCNFFASAYILFCFSVDIFAICCYTTHVQDGWKSWTTWLTDMFWLFAKTERISVWGWRILGSAPAERGRCTAAVSLWLTEPAKEYDWLHESRWRYRSCLSHDQHLILLAASTPYVRGHAPVGDSRSVFIMCACGGSTSMGLFVGYVQVFGLCPPSIASWTSDIWRWRKDESGWLASVCQHIKDFTRPYWFLDVTWAPLYSVQGAEKVV